MLLLPLSQLFCLIERRNYIKKVTMMHKKYTLSNKKAHCHTKKFHWRLLYIDNVQKRNLSYKSAHENGLLQRVLIWRVGVRLWFLVARERRHSRKQHHRFGMAQREASCILFYCNSDIWRRKTERCEKYLIFGLNGRKGSHSKKSKKEIWHGCQKNNSSPRTHLRDEKVVEFK